MSECHPKRLLSLFPTNSCHQQVVTTGDLKKKRSSGSSLFPINRCHQRVVTRQASASLLRNHPGFHSISVTSVW